MVCCFSNPERKWFHVVMGWGGSCWLACAGWTGAIHVYTSVRLCIYWNAISALPTNIPCGIAPMFICANFCGLGCLACPITTGIMGIIGSSKPSREAQCQILTFSIMDGLLIGWYVLTVIQLFLERYVSQMMDEHVRSEMSDNQVPKEALEMIYGSEEHGQFILQTIKPILETLALIPLSIVWLVASNFALKDAKQAPPQSNDTTVLVGVPQIAAPPHYPYQTLVNNYGASTPGVRVIGAQHHEDNFHINTYQY